MALGYGGELLPHLILYSVKGYLVCILCLMRKALKLL